jgi:hypothetical protein
MSAADGFGYDIRRLVSAKVFERGNKMIGVINRLDGVVCEVGTCYVTATHSEDVTVIPWDPALRHERHAIDIVLCQRHDAEFHQNGLVGTVTAYGDEIAPGVQ